MGNIFADIIKQGVEIEEFDADLDIDAFVPAIVGAWDMIGRAVTHIIKIEEELCLDIS